MTLSSRAPEKALRAAQPWPLALAALACFACFAGAVRAQPPQTEASRKAHAANVNLGVTRRVWPTGKPAEIHVSLYNCRSAQLAAYPVDLEQLAPDANALVYDDARDKRSLAYRLKALDLATMHPAKTWPVQVKKFYRDQWMEQKVEVPALPQGVYVIAATGGGVVARTWLAISSEALLVKRSPDKILGWLVDAQTGQPAEHKLVALYGPDKRIVAQWTSGQGLVSFPAGDLRGACYLAARTGPPAFALANDPGRQQPYRIFVYTDRPIYRPGQAVRFRGTIRAVDRGRYGLPPRSLETAQVTIRAPRGGTVYQKDLPLDAYGTFESQFALAPEPPLGRYDVVTTFGVPGKRTVAYSSFEVQAYRKPEFDVDVSIPKPHYLGGAKIPVTISAKYYFGSPVSGGKLHYQVSFRGQWPIIQPDVLTAAGLGSAAVAQVEQSFSGDAILDKDGKFVLEVPTKYVPRDRTMTVQATVEELALRPRSASASTLITAAKFRIFLNLENQPYVVGDKAQVRVRTVDYDGKPVSALVKLTLVEMMKDREGRTYQQKTSRDVETSSKGEAEATFPLPRPDQYTVKAWAIDDGGNPTAAQMSFQVLKKRPPRQWPALAASADKASYETGDVAQIHVETNLVGGWMLATVEGQYLYDARVYKVGANAFDLKVPIKEAYKPGVYLHLAIVRDGELTATGSSLSVPHNGKRLNIILEPDRESYEPGQKARWTVITRTPGGAGVAAQLGLGVVDESLYAIREDRTPSPFSFFWGQVARRVTTDFSFARLYPGGGFQVAQGGEMMMGTAVGRRAQKATMPAAPATFAAEGRGGAAGNAAPRIRRTFLDTAFWGPSVMTAPDGSGSVSFTIPDNLTTWRATARGITRNTLAGEARKDVKVTMPLLVRLELPRFYVQGDVGTAAAIVHNYTGKKRTVKVTLTAEGAELVKLAPGAGEAGRGAASATDYVPGGSPERTIELANDAIKKVTWTVRPTGPAKARFLVSADGGPGARDAMETTLPIVPNGVKNVDAWAGVTDAEAEQPVPLPADALAKSAKLEITLAPSLAGPIFEALDYLTNYPYGCAEQTMDSFLPDVIVARTFRKLDVDYKPPAMLDRYVSFGLQKLQRYQHNDGGWHWWEFDNSDPYITAYVVYGLKIADDAGYVGAHEPMVRGVAYLRQALVNEEYRESQAYLLWSLAFADVWDRDSLAQAVGTADKLFGERAKLNIFSRASLARAMERLSRQNTLDAATKARLAKHADTMAGELEGEAKHGGLGVNWTADARQQYSWTDNDVEVTAQALMALIEVRPHSPDIVPAIRWLMAARQGKHWSSTKDTAAAVLALAAYLGQHRAELTPHFTAKVLVNGEAVGEETFGAADVFAAPKTITVAADQLRKDAAAGQAGNTLRLEKSGTGTLYWSARLSYLIPPDKAIPLAKGITVQRTYRVPTQDPVEAGVQTAGSVVQVELRIESDRNLRYVMLEEPIPAGCEVVSGDGSNPRGSPWDRREVWDNRIVFFFDYLPRGGKVVDYVLRTEEPGLYNILPTEASLMYFPEVRGRDGLVRMRVAAPKD